MLMECKYWSRTIILQFFQCELLVIFCLKRGNSNLVKYADGSQMNTAISSKKDRATAHESIDNHKNQSTITEMDDM